MIHESNSQGIAFDTARRNGGLDIGDEGWRWFGAAGELPSNEIQPTAGLRRTGIVEVLAIEVIGEWWADARLRGNGLSAMSVQREVLIR